MISYQDLDGDQVLATRVATNLNGTNDCTMKWS